VWWVGCRSADAGMGDDEGGGEDADVVCVCVKVLWERGVS
jgi:hypothetical protein